MAVRPLLHTGRLAEDARKALDALSRALLKLEPADLRGPSIAGGQAGIALTHAYLAPFFPKRAHALGLQTMIEAAMESIASHPSSPSLVSGFVGLAWVVQHLQGDSLPEGDEDPNAAIDAELGQWLDHSPWTMPFDLIEGLTGLAVYGLERLPRASGKMILEKVVDRLAEAASPEKPEKKAIAWATHSEWIPEQYRGDRPARYLDCGLAHGQAGPLGVLAAIAAADVAKETKVKAAGLLEKGMTWMLANRLPDSSVSRYPTWIVADKTPGPSRDAWCYGDPGIAVALLGAARAVKSKKWENAALDVALHAARRPMKDSMCIDPGLCHGSFGAAQIFLRLYRMTEDRVFADRARAYLSRGLGQRGVKHEGQGKTKGFAGFLAYDVGPNMKPGWKADAAYLTGGAGIALALAAALSPGDEDPGWDRVLLMSTPGTSA